MPEDLFTQSGHTEKTTLFVEVALPLPIDSLFTYRVPFTMNEQIKTGCRVIVQFGARKILTGIVVDVHENPPMDYEAKSILEVLDPEPLVTSTQLELFKWVSEYYMSSLGEVVNVALPAGLKISSESRIQLNPHFDFELPHYEFSDKEWEVLDKLNITQVMSYKEIAEITGTRNIYSLIKSLVEKDAVLIFEEVIEKYQPKKQKRIRLTEAYSGEQVLDELLVKLEKREKQVEIILRYLRELPVIEDPQSNEAGIAKSTFTADHSPSSLKTLIKNGIFEEFEIVIPRFPDLEDENNSSFNLSSNQQKAREEILDSFKSKKPVLLHGVTGSGKTEIYMDLIREQIDDGNQVLYLLPEIALTTQIVTRLQKVFGSRLGVYHSKFSDNERVEIWKGLLEGRFSFIVGVRSSVFLPFQNLSLIIVDEEHETSYKQFDPAPRYHARDMALMMSSIHGSDILLGSATPSLESYYHSATGKYTRVGLHERYGESILPDVKLVDVIRETRKKRMRNEFSEILLEAIKNTLSKNEQCIIFQNRRGYAPWLSCTECGHTPKCKNCAVSLTYHLSKNELKCHYCGYSEWVPSNCPECSSTDIRTVSYGTEKLEENLRLILPETRIQRMDLDTTRKKSSYQRIISDFEDAEIDILVGTQMVSKGLDFDRVSLVGILDADRMMHFPDFRSFERSFQLITQVSGRAGRRDKPGTVLIQTKKPDHPLLKTILSHDYNRFYTSEIGERELYGYPPFTRLIKLSVRSEDRGVLNSTAEVLGSNLREALGSHRVLGPQEPLIGRIRNRYIMEILVKLERDKVSPGKVKRILSEKVSELLKDKRFRKAEVIFDVDPY